VAWRVSSCEPPSISFDIGHPSPLHASNFEVKFRGKDLDRFHQFYMRIERGPGDTGSREFHRGATISTHASNFDIELREV
jgi:hypothetical protein